MTLKPKEISYPEGQEHFEDVFGEVGLEDVGKVTGDSPGDPNDGDGEGPEADARKVFGVHDSRRRHLTV